MGALRGYLLLLSSMALVGSYVALSKPLTSAMPVFLLAWLRFAIAALAMIPWTRRAPGEAPLTAGERSTLFRLSFFGNFLFSVCMLYGVSLTSATAAGLIFASLPAVVAVLSWLMLGERLGRRTLLAILFAVAGVAALTTVRPAQGAGVSALGNLLVFGAAICESLYVILGKRLTASLSPKRISALINLVGLALMTPFGLWQAITFDFASFDAGLWLLLVFYSLAASMWAVWLWMTGLEHVPASHSGVFMIALPIASSLVAVTWLGERFTMVHALALGCAAAGIALIAWPGRGGASPGPAELAAEAAAGVSEPAAGHPRRR